MADNFNTKKIQTIIIEKYGRTLQPATVNGTDHYPGLGVTWESASGTEYDIDVAEDDDAAWAGILDPGGYHDLETVLADNQAVGVCPPGTLAWGKFVASCGNLIRGDDLGIDGTSDGYFTALTGAGILARGYFRYSTEKDQYHADIAAVSIQGVDIAWGGTVALV